MNEFFMTLQQEIVSHADTDTKVLLKQKKHHLLSAMFLSDTGKAKLLQQENWCACHSNPSASLKGQVASFSQQGAGMCHLSERRWKNT